MHLILGMQLWCQRKWNLDLRERQSMQSLDRNRLWMNMASIWSNTRREDSRESRGKERNGWKSQNYHKFLLTSTVYLLPTWKQMSPLCFWSRIKKYIPIIFRHNFCLVLTIHSMMILDGIWCNVYAFRNCATVCERNRTSICFQLRDKNERSPDTA